MALASPPLSRRRFGTGYIAATRAVPNAALVLALALSAPSSRPTKAARKSPASPTKVRNSPSPSRRPEPQISEVLRKISGHTRDKADISEPSCASSKFQAPSTREPPSHKLQRPGFHVPLTLFHHS